MQDYTPYPDFILIGLYLLFNPLVIRKTVEGHSLFFAISEMHEITPWTIRNYRNFAYNVINSLSALCRQRPRCAENDFKEGKEMKKILLAIDGSECAKKAVAYVGEQFRI